MGRRRQLAASSHRVHSGIVSRSHCPLRIMTRHAAYSYSLLPTPTAYCLLRTAYFSNEQCKKRINCHINDLDADEWSDDATEAIVKEVAPQERSWLRLGGM